AVVEPDMCEEVREAMLGLRQRLRGHKAGDKLHWNHLEPRQRQAAVKQVAALPGFHVVTVGSPVPQRRQERARAVCLGRLIVELHQFGVTRLLMEAREQELNGRDVRTVTGARFLLPKGSEFRVDHEFGLRDPALWAADLVAGAVRAHRLGDSTYWRCSPTVSSRPQSSRAADHCQGMRKARLPVCPRSPGLASRPAPAVPG
ncbi:MAG: hypothetical protein LC799_00805, partial [Actinobacteria bacterium]|nr:hypothetical protein [Actinomycetota bacterium]